MDLTLLALAKGYTDKQIEKAEMGGFQLDPSLTKEGFAADAKAVGEAISKTVGAPGPEGPQGPQGEPGASGVHVGTEPPTDDTANVWVNTNESASGSDFIYSPSIASIGQTIVVKAIDETGKPIQWEATDLPKGSSIETHHINTLTLEEDAQWVYFDKDSEGNPFELKELAINVYSVGAEGNTSEAYFKVIPNHNTYVSGNQVADIPSGIRLKGSTRSMAIKVHGDGVLAYSVCSSQDNVNAFDDNMLLTGRLGSGGASLCSSVYGLSAITSLLFGSDKSSVLLGKGTKIAVWGR